MESRPGHIRHSPIHGTLRLPNDDDNDDDDDGVEVDDDSEGVRVVLYNIMLH